MNPDCKSGKHAACRADSWDDKLDQPTTCSCTCHDDRKATRRDSNVTRSAVMKMIEQRGLA